MIELDTSLSFELDDFDPLKPNAKKIPMPVSKPQSKFYTSTTAAAAAVSNPVYPFYTPPSISNSTSTTFTNSNTTTTATSTTAGKLSQFDEDLLRNFGLNNLVDSNRGYRSTHIMSNQHPQVVSRSSTNAANEFRMTTDATDSRSELMQQPNQLRSNKNWTTFD